MMTTGTPWTWMLMSFAAGVGAAQQVPPQPASAPARVPAAASATAPAKSAQSEAGEPRVTGIAQPPSGVSGATAPKVPGAVDRLNLGTATVTGDHEQPKVMYIVPWKSSSIGDLSGKPMNSLLDEALAPVDREEFKREVAYYEAVKAAPQNGVSPPAAKQGEK